MTQQAKRDLYLYAAGFVGSAVLTLVAFWSVMGSGGLSRKATLWIVGGTAILQVAVQLRCFLHIGWRQKREELQLILFSIVLLCLMGGGMIWIMDDLGSRMS